MPFYPDFSFIVIIRHQKVIHFHSYHKVSEAIYFYAMRCRISSALTCHGIVESPFPSQMLKSESLGQQMQNLGFSLIHLVAPYVFFFATIRSGLRAFSSGWPFLRRTRCFRGIHFTMQRYCFFLIWQCVIVIKLQ